MLEFPISVLLGCLVAVKAQTTFPNFESDVLNEHNKFRALHVDTAPLTWSDTLATYAQNYADQYDCSGVLTHSDGPYGENLALGYTDTGAVDAWYGEISKYNYSNPGFSESTGHFTQVVWKSAAEIGCGYKYCGTTWNNLLCAPTTLPETTWVSLRRKWNRS